MENNAMADTNENMPEIKYVDKAYLEKQFKNFYNNVIHKQTQSFHDWLERLDEAVVRLDGEDTVEGSVKYTVKEAVDAAISKLVDAAPETLDTFKEIADWIASDETGTANIVKRIGDLETGLSETNGNVGQNTKDIAEIKQAIADMNSTDPENENSIINKINNIINNLQKEDEDIDFSNWA